MNTPTQDQLLNAAIMLDGAHPAVAAMLVRLAEQQAAEPVACDKDPRGCWNVRCQLGGVCKNTHPAPTQHPLTQPEGCKLVPVERSYDMRVQAILHFNTAKKNGADLDDCLEAAWRATLAAPDGITGSKT